jgi:hypothetical protein
VASTNEAETTAVSAPPISMFRPHYRHRHRELPGFNFALRPLPHEWGVDQLQIGVTGTWRSVSGGREFFSRSFSDPFSDWLTAPKVGGNRIEVETRKNASTTLQFHRLSASSINGHFGTIKADVRCNPTRTLESLLSRYGDEIDFRERVAALTVPDFFASYAGLRSLDGNDNWIRDPVRARLVLGDDISAAFLPIYLDQLQVAVMLVLSENLDGYAVDGADHVWRQAGDEIRLNWNKATVPQVETYFERYHPNAIEAIRIAGVSLLTRDHRSIMRGFGGELDIEREADCFSISMPIGTRRLVIYAKRPDRIRFEIRRKRRGRYPRFDPPVLPADRLLNILSYERSEAARVGRWEEVGAQFGEPDQPTPGDLVQLIRRVMEACGITDPTAHRLLGRLLADGGISPALTNDLSPNVVHRLLQLGVIARTRVRTRDLTASDPRFALTEHYDLVREHLLRVFPPSEIDAD